MRRFGLFLLNLITAEKLKFTKGAQCGNCASVILDGSGKWEIKKGVLDQTAIAYGTFDDTLNSTGWGVLDIVGQEISGLSIDQAFYATGILEGVLTAERIAQNARTMNEFWALGDKQEKISQFFQDQLDWARQQVTANSNDPYWKNIGYVINQLAGLFDGASSVEKKLAVWDIQLLNGVGDLIDLTRALFPESRPNLNNLNLTQLNHLEHTSGHCSALVRVTPGFENLYMGHSSWFYYGATNRIFKHYTFKTSDPSIVAQTQSFSSYAGYLESLDDFYVMSSGLVMLQTTINCLNHSLYDNVSSESLLAWQRVRVANQMAKNGKEWADYSMRQNSGTYNNQYMVIDTNLFEYGKPLQDNILWVIEQMPGNTASGDQTDYLRMGGFWPSYNVPFYKNIYDVSGNAAAAEKYGPSKSYELAPRAKIFRRDAPNVNSFYEFQDILRYNDFMNDKYGERDPWNAICSRGDLVEDGTASPNGCYDTKATHFAAAKNMEAWALNGPTESHGLPAFDWSSFPDQPHYGLPEKFVNKFAHMKSKLAEN